MAILLPGKSETIRVALKIDSAIDLDDELYGKYLDTLDESLLNLKEGEEPTWFVMRKVLPFALSKKVQNEQTAMKDGEVQVNISFIGEEVRCALVDIINPASVPVDQHIIYAKEKDGGTSIALMEQLVAAGVVNDLYRARNAKLSQTTELMKKK
jgi:hypothetical protein